VPNLASRGYGPAAHRCAADRAWSARSEHGTL